MLGDEDLESLPRDFYEPIVLVRDGLTYHGVPDEEIEETLDSIEILILQALGCAEESSGDETEDQEARG
jgi:hypothetical protein